MDSIAEGLAEVDAVLDAVLARVSAELGERAPLRDTSDDDLLRAAAFAGAVQRRVDGFLVEVVGELSERIDKRPHEERPTTTHGCRNLSELLQRATRCAPHTAASYARVSRYVHRRVAPSTGERLPAELPALRAALQEGVIGLDAMTAVLGPLDDLRRAVDGETFLRVEGELASAARGEDAPAAGWAELRLLAQVLVAYLDPDGAEPRDALAVRKRGVTLGLAKDGVIPIRGNLLPDVAAQLQRIFDCLLSPKTDVPGVMGPHFEESGEMTEAEFARQNDVRTRAQKQHDALATALTVAARAGDLPSIGGAAPTLIVSVRAEDYAAGTGRGSAEGSDEPVPMSVARQVACAGSIQRVVYGEGGRILSIGVTDRVFTHHQRLAIARRDGGCIIPGCAVPAGWCEIHHVTEHARGGPTHTDNGVLLCWFHHRNLDAGHWQVRMNGGVPEIRGPAWWDAYRRWRPVGSAWQRAAARRTG